ncbi:MAG: hypothetical protein Q4B48_02720 [Syntrophomonadaceae bacterium]|nr:hypothetical protein [Syntrophomonadaceae bacterium]
MNRQLLTLLLLLLTLLMGIRLTGYNQAYVAAFTQGNLIEISVAER